MGIQEGEYPNQLVGVDGITDTNVGPSNKLSLPVKIASLSGAGGIFLQSGTGAPTALGGNVGDLYIRADGTDGTYFYRCTVAGVAGGATWAAITGA